MLFLKHATGAAVCCVGAAARRASIAVHWVEHLAAASIYLIIITPCVYGALYYYGRGVGVVL